MMLEDDVRATLRERADQPPAAVQPDLLDQVRGGIRRSNRRRAAVLGAVAVVVAATAVPFALRNEAAPAPPPAATPSTGPAWAKPQVELPTFPLTPGWVPPGAGPARVGQLGASGLLIYKFLQVEVGATPGDWEAEGVDRTITLNGRKATLRTVEEDVYQGGDQGDRYVGVRWRLADGQWVQLISSGKLTEEQVLRFARELKPVTVPPTPAQFTIAAAPAGLVLQQLTETGMCLSPPAARSYHDDARGICVYLDVVTAETGTELQGERLTLGGRQAWIDSDAGGPDTLSVKLDAKRLLTVWVNREDLPLTREDLVRFTEGVTVNPS